MIINDILSEYEDCKPSRMVSMLYALKDQSLLALEFPHRDTNQVKLAQSLTVKLKKQGIPYSNQSIQGGLGKNNTLSDEVNKISGWLS